MTDSKLWVGGSSPPWHTKMKRTGLVAKVLRGLILSAFGGTDVLD